MHKNPGQLKAVIKKMGRPTAALLIVSIFLLAILWSGRNTITPLRAADEAFSNRLVAAPNDVFVPVIFGSGIADSGGMVYRDYNGNGTRDTYEPGVPGIIVSAYRSNGYRVT
ncbi:MAG: hypothetical protein R3293_23330, partial [Candidatus Promineifilaceae bacterium]|nr:hypothetical protein [Candidatus Promineifilaceae bacterium]